MFTQFDTAIAVATFIFITLGFFKGAIKSILGLGKWYGAGVLTLLFYPKVSDAVAQYMQPGMVANGIAVFLTYVGILVVLSVIIGIFLAALGKTVGGPGDRVMGSVVGLSIGLIVASTAHYFIRSFSGGTDPDWLQKGKTYQITSQGADRLQGYFKNVVGNMGKDMGFDTGFVKDIDPTGGLNKQIDSASASGSQIDFDKLKEAIRLMKENGATPQQIREMININDYTLPQGAAGMSADSAKATANEIVKKSMEQLKKLQGASDNNGINNSLMPTGDNDGN